LNEKKEGKARRSIDGLKERRRGREEERDYRKGKINFLGGLKKILWKSCQHKRSADREQIT
jgi:hypothetical protein